MTDPERFVTTTRDFEQALHGDPMLRRALYRELAREIVAGLPRCLYCGRIMLGARANKKYCNERCCGSSYRRNARLAKVPRETLLSPTK